MSAQRGLRIVDYVSHIIEAINRINRYLQGETEASFLRDEMLQDAAIRNIEVIGEVARNVERVAPEFAADHPDIPWALIYAMRNRLSHGYFEVDLELVWRTIRQDLPLLAGQMRALKGELDVRPEQ